MKKLTWELMATQVVRAAIYGGMTEYDAKLKARRVVDVALRCAVSTGSVSRWLNEGGIRVSTAAQVIERLEPDLYVYLHERFNGGR